jgi:hypothetical protein
MKMPFLLISPKIVPKIQLIKKGGCFEYHAVIADKIKYRYVHRASICPALGMDRRSFFMPKPMGKYKRLEVFYLSKPVYTADKPSDCHYCYFWTNGRKGCRNVMAVPMGEITRALVGVRRRLCVKWGFVDMDVYEQEYRFYYFARCPYEKTDTTFRSIPLTTESFPQKEGGEAV